MKIEKHISALLYRYQCVTVPGFGAFLAEFQPAQIDADTNTFYPPKKLISFNANLKNNDGLLANHIALQEKISYEDAVHILGRTVEEWYSNLSTRETLTIKDLGALAYNIEGSLVFNPETPVNYLTDSFGLSIITSPAIKREGVTIQNAVTEKTTPIHFIPKRRNSYTYLKYAAIFVIAAGAGSAGFKVYRDREVTAQTLVVEKAVQEKVHAKIQEATFFIESPLPAVRLAVKDNTRQPYHVVAGAFRSEANAQKAFNQLTALGYKAKRLEINRFGLYPVLYGSYGTYAEAYRDMSLIQKAHNKEAWLLIKEL